MQKNIKQTDVLRQITKYIRQNLELQVILTAASADLRSFLGIDRVKVCKFNPDGSGQVIAESVDDNCLPAMLGLHFPGDEIPAETRELYIKVRVRSIVNAANFPITLLIARISYLWKNLEYACILG